MSRTLEQTAWLRMESTWGPIRIEARGGRITSCSLPKLRSEPAQAFRWTASRFGPAGPNDRKVLKQARRYVISLFEGRPIKPPPIAWPPAAPFTRRVWQMLLSVPPGASLEYGELAKKVGRPGGARAVGRACGANPLPLFIPCHRVQARDGGLGGFTPGRPWKRRLLEVESLSAGGPTITGAKRLRRPASRKRDVA